MTYDIDYFIKKFEAIPEELWTTDLYVDQDDETKRCALGHCGCAEFSERNPEADTLFELFVEAGMRVPRVNDGCDPRFSQPTPKQRILAALKHIKETKE